MTVIYPSTTTTLKHPQKSIEGLAKIWAMLKACRFSFTHLRPESLDAHEPSCNQRFLMLSVIVQIKVSFKLCN